MSRNCDVTGDANRKRLAQKSFGERSLDLVSLRISKPPNGARFGTIEKTTERGLVIEAELCGLEGPCDFKIMSYSRSQLNFDRRGKPQAVCPRNELGYFKVFE